MCSALAIPIRRVGIGHVISRRACRCRRALGHGKSRRSYMKRRWTAATLATCISWGVAAGIPTVTSAVNQFGGQDRADAARQLIVLGVQRALSQLPPASGQGRVESEDSLLPSAKYPGPVAWRSTETVGY